MRSTSSFNEPGNEDNVSFQKSSRSKSGRRWIQGLLLGAIVVLLIANYSNHWLSATGATIDSRRRERLPDFEFSQLGGGSWRLSEHRGQIVLVNFWATWCPPCRKETPGLVQLSQRIRSKEVVIVGISMDENKNAVPGFVQAFHVPYPVLLPGSESPLTSSVESLPTSLLLDRQGRVAHSYIGAVSEDVFARDIAQLLGETNQISPANS